jgi:hypothetical protein
MELKTSASGTSLPCCGQYAANSSYVRRPKSMVSEVEICSFTTLAISSLKYGKCQRSGDSTTPSSEMKSPALIFRMVVSCR